MAIEYPVKITYSNDTSSLKKAQKQVDKGSKNKPSKSMGVGGVATGVALGGLAGGLLKSLDGVQKILQVIGEALNAFIAPFIPILLTLLKPFLGLFLIVGSYLSKWLKLMLSGGTGKAGEGATKTNDKGEVVAGDTLLKALGLLAAAIAGIVAAILGAPVLLTVGIAVLAGFLETKLAKPFIDFGLWLAGIVDNLFNTDFVGAVSTFFQGITDAIMGFFDILWSLVHLDWGGVKEGLIRMLLGTWEMLKGIFLVGFNILKGLFVALWDVLKNVFLWAFNLLKTILTNIWKFLKNILINSFNVLKTLGRWIWDSVTSMMSGSFHVLSNIGGWIKDKIKGFFSFGKKRNKSVNDAIITPTGQVLQTSPRDYLFATKSPENLGGGSGTNNITINVQGNADQNVIDEIVRRLQQELRTRGGY